MTPELFIENSGWVFARTMPHMPHEYTVRDLPSGARSTCMSDESFEWFVRHIREHGYRETYGSSTYTYLEIDGWRYWTMGAPVEQTTIINRARIEAAVA